jgi:segregation and condensation protein B
MARRQRPEADFDRELFDLPPELRWREWKARVEAVLFAAAKPVSREVLARVVGRDCALDLLLDDLKEDLRGRPVELVRAGEGFALHTRPAFGPAVRVAFGIPADARELTNLEAGVLMAIAMFQPATRGEICEMFGREISRDLIASLREEGLITAGPRSPKLGAPYAYVTTEKFLLEFGFESLRDLPDLEALRDAGLIGIDASPGAGSADAKAEDAGGRLAPSEVSRHRVAQQHDLAKARAGAVTRTEFGRRKIGEQDSDSGRGGGPPPPEGFLAEDAERAAAREMALDVESVLDGSVNG